MRKKMIKKLLEKKKNGQIKVHYKHEDAKSLLHDTSSRTKCMNQISKY